MVFRLDSGIIHKAEKTPEGFLRFYANFSKVGELRYLKNDGSIQTEHLTEEELFRDDSLQTLVLQPVTLNHPEVGLVTPENSRQYQRGLTGDRIVKNYPYATIIGVATDRETIDAIESGTNQISAGYTCKIRERSDGTFEQYDRVYNHIAVVPTGRAGSDVRIHLDSEEDFAVQISEGIPTPTDQVDLPLIDRKDSPKMTIVTLGNRNYNIDGDDAPKLADAVATLLTEHAETLTKHDADLTTAKSATVAETKRADAAEAKLEVVSAEKTQLTQKLDAAEQTRMDADQISTEVEARLGTWQIVLPLLRQDAADFQPDYKLSVSEIQKLAIAKKFPEIKLDGKSDDAISAMWELTEPALKQVETRTDSSQDLFELVTVAQSNTEYRVDALDSARKKAAQAYADAWKQGEKE